MVLKHSRTSLVLINVAVSAPETQLNITVLIERSSQKNNLTLVFVVRSCCPRSIENTIKGTLRNLEWFQQDCLKSLPSSTSCLNPENAVQKPVLLK